MPTPLSANQKMYLETGKLRKEISDLKRRVQELEQRLDRVGQTDPVGCPS